MSSDDWPSLAEELGRKVTDVMEKRLAQYEAGKISFREIYLILNDVYDSVSGLCDRDILKVLATAIEEVKRDHRLKAKRS